MASFVAKNKKAKKKGTENEFTKILKCSVQKRLKKEKEHLSCSPQNATRKGC